MGILSGVCDNLGCPLSVCLTASYSLRVIRKSLGQDLLGSVCVCVCVCVCCACVYQHAAECVFSLCIRRPNTVPGKGFHRTILA